MNTPGYYSLNNGDVISASFQANEGPGFCRWLAIKYIIRAGHKPSITAASDISDIEKAIDVLDRWLTHLKNQEG